MENVYSYWKTTDPIKEMRFEEWSLVASVFSARLPNKRYINFRNHHISVLFRVASKDVALEHGLQLGHYVRFRGPGNDNPILQILNNNCSPNSMTLKTNLREVS